MDKDEQKNFMCGPVGLKISVSASMCGNPQEDYIELSGSKDDT